MKPGPRALPANVIDARGTAKPTRPRHNIVPHLDGEITIPAWLKGRGRKLFIERCDVYAQRRQVIRGCEEALAHYCALSASLEVQWRKEVKVSAADLAQLRQWMSAFFDTPDSQVASGKAPVGDNPFSNNGKAPPAS